MIHISLLCNYLAAMRSLAYSRLKYLKTSTNAKVHDVKTGKAFARKIIRALNVPTAELANEIRAINKLVQTTHENLVEYFSHGNLLPFLYFFDMELCEGNLRDLIL